MSQLMDIAVRVKSVREYCVKQMVSHKRVVHGKAEGTNNVISPSSAYCLTANSWKLARKGILTLKC
jgi:hypothetical protein